MLSGAYSNTYKNLERQNLDTIKTFAENEKLDSIARAKKLSIETNRRRRALAIKRKAESEKEERRRQQILAKRREQQNEATQKFQRANMPARPPSSGRWSPRHRTGSNLDDALKMVRGTNRAQSARASHDRTSPAPNYYRQNTDPLSKPYFNKYAHPSVNQSNKTKDKQEALHNKSLLNLNNSRTLFEQQLETHQQSLVDQQQKALRDFNKQIMKEIEVDRNIVMHNGDYHTNPILERSESVSTADSLEEHASADTLRESCDLDTFMEKSDISNVNANNRTVSFAEPAVSDITTVTYSGSVQNGGSIRQKNIDSYSTQQTVIAPQTPEQKQQFYLQRQQEIQQQLQEQQQQQLRIQQQQQQELKQKVLEQQQKQHLLLQQQFSEQQQQQEPPMSGASVTTANTNGTGSFYLQRDDEKENFRPKAQMKAWATPSPHPPPPTSAVTAQQSYFTNASPYTGKSTITNMTVTTYDKVPVSNYASSVSSGTTYMSGTAAQSGHTISQPQTITATVNQSKPSDLTQGASLTSVNGKSVPASGMALLEEITNGLTLTQDAHVTNTAVDSAKVRFNTTTVNATSKTPLVQPPKQQLSQQQSQQQQQQLQQQTSQLQQQAQKQQQAVKPQSHSSSSAVSMANVTTPATISTTLAKTQNNNLYINSYGAAYQARLAQSKAETQKPKQATVSEAQAMVSPITDNATVANKAADTTVPSVEPRRETFGLVNGQLVTFNGDEGADVTDTDSVSTICADESPDQPKEVRGILKHVPKKGGILKKSGSTGNIRDSLEITRVNLQTSAEEREQRPSKKNVRFADMSYDEEPESDEQAKFFVARDNISNKPPRPVSAAQTKINQSSNRGTDGKPPRASSASTIRTSSIPRAKTQVVRPTATAHIIQSISSPPTEPDNSSKKVMVVNGTVLDKVVRAANVAPQVATPASVYAMSSVNYSRPSEQKVNYAVSSIVMPKTDSASYVYSNYVSKQMPSPMSVGSNVPMQATSNFSNDGAVFDENGIRIDRTPTDDEINFLWDKVRSCLSRNSQATPDAGPHDLHRQAAPVANTYIDGNALGQFNSMSRVAAQSPGLRRQSSLEGINSNSSYSKRQVLLQQRKQQPNPNSLKGRQNSGQNSGPGVRQEYTVYHAPVQSHLEPQASPMGINNNDITESMAQFLVAEQLTEQNLSESRIQQVMEDTQIRQQSSIAPRPPQPKGKSALSMEEQRLLESLDRLNEKLQVTENTIPNNNTVPAFVLQKQQQSTQQQPSQQQQHKQQHVVHRSSFLTPDGKMGGFRGHTPLTQRRVIENPTHQKARLKLTTAALKRNLHRQQ